MRALLLALCLASAVAADDLAEAVERGDWVRVEELARERLATDAGDREAHGRLGQALLRRARAFAGQDGLAAELAVSAVDQAVGHLAHVTDDPRFRDAWLEARAEHPRPEPGLDDALEALAEQGDPHAAFLWALGRPPASSEAALARLDAAIAARPDRADYRLARLGRLVALGRLDEAGEAWWRAVERDADPDVLAAWSVQVWPGRDGALERAGQLERFTELRGARADPWLGWYRAHAFAEAGRPERALEVFDATAGDRPPEVTRAHAGLLAGAGRYAEAAELLLPFARARDWTAFEQAVSVADGMALARDFDAALELYEALLSVEARDERAQHHRALTLWRAGRADAAEAAFATVVERWRGRSDLLNDAGLAAWGAGRLDRAAQLFERAMELPQSLDARENRAALALARDEDDRARIGRWIEEVLAVEEGRARALVLRARLRSRG